MQAFWWYKENLIAGMGRPGFNRINWLDFTPEIAELLGWLGRYESGTFKRQ